MGVPWRLSLALLMGAGPPLLLGLWPAPEPAHHHAMGHGDHTPLAAAQAEQATPVPDGVGAPAWDGALPPWPDPGRTLEVGPGKGYDSLAGALAAARDGDRILLFGGMHPGPVKLERRVWLEGEAGAVLTGSGRGKVVTVTAPGARITGLAIRESGGSLDAEDAGVFVDGAAGAVVAGCTLERVQFGVVAKGSPGVLIAGNRVTGRDGDLSLNGDGIRVWFSDGARVVANSVRRTREILIEQTQGAELLANAIVDGRQGLHLMRAPLARAERNFVAGNSAGIYVMYGAGTEIAANRVQANRGPSGYGVGLKEADGARVQGNWLVGNRVGIYLDNSPLDPARPSRIEQNLVGYNDVGVLMTPSTHDNRVRQNDFLENFQQAGVAGDGDLGENLWTVDGTGNYWSDYEGYDADADRVGDLPYLPVRLFEGWMDRQPDLRWFWFTPAAAAVDLGARAFPLAAPEPLLADLRPRIAPEDRRENPWSSYSR